jgi:hypothetical protein
MKLHFKIPSFLYFQTQLKKSQMLLSQRVHTVSIVRCSPDLGLVPSNARVRKNNGTHLLLPWPPSEKKAALNRNGATSRLLSPSLIS